LFFWGLAGDGRAEPKPTIWGWWPWHYSHLDFNRRYLENGTTPQHSDWETDDWTPQVWTDARANPQEVMNGFYNAGIITDQYVDDGIPVINTGHGVPVLEVGPNFLRLSDNDKRRVVAYVDSVAGITSHDDGMFYIRYNKGNKPLGIYTKYGLQLQ
jgi:hypothetical protein